jgi:signal transduction histidine kinase
MLLGGDYGEISDKQREVLSELEVLASRMNELVNALLNVSRIEMGTFIIEPTPTDFAALCREVINEMRPSIETKRHTVEENLQQGLPKIPADVKLLRVIYQNFLSNAIKYTQDEGRIKVTLKKEGGDIIFSVANNGEPIPKDAQPKIFEKMYRAKNAQKQDADGNGLGLYLIKQIIGNAGGKIWFTSVKGEDTVFSVSFPLTGMVPKHGEKRLTTDFN